MGPQEIKIKLGFVQIENIQQNMYLGNKYVWEKRTRISKKKQGV